jgi:hypothetical protein
VATYPGAIPDFAEASPSNLGDADSKGRTHSQRHNVVEQELEAALTELGTNPSGSAATVAARLSAIEAGVAGALTPAEVVAGANITVDTTTTPGSAIINATAVGSGGTEPGVIEFDDPSFTGSTDDDRLDEIMSYAAAQTQKPTIRLRYGITTLTRGHDLYTGFALVGAGGGVPVEQIRSGNPYASRVNVRLTGTAGSTFCLRLNQAQTHRVSIQNISWEGNTSSSWIGSTNTGYVLWTSTLRDLAFSAFYSVLGSRQYKLLNTAILCDGWWNVNNAHDVSIHMGGSDSILWVGSNFLLDSPTSLNAAVNCHMWMDYQEKTIVGGGFITGEQEPAAIRVSGGTSTDGLTFYGVRAEGRNAGAPSYGSTIRIEGGEVTFRDCWIAYGYADPGSSGRTGEGGVVSVLGGSATFDGCGFAASTGNNTEASPYLFATGASTKVRIRNQRVIGTNVPYVKAVSGATINADDTVVPVTGTSLVCDDWLAWRGTQAAYDAIAVKDPRRLYVITA